MQGMDHIGAIFRVLAVPTSFLRLTTVQEFGQLVMVEQVRVPKYGEGAANPEGVARI